MAQAAQNTTTPTPPADAAQKPAPNAKGKAAEPKLYLVIDTTAVDGPRIHDQIVDGIVKPFTFERGKALPLSFEIAAKFLKHEAFKLVNAAGEIIPWRRRPKQPEELGAGEKIKLADDETIARYDELASGALLQRAVELPGGEKFAQAKERPERSDMIAFITEAAMLKKKAPLSREKDIGDDAFVPEAETDDDGDAD